jgi:hypothetical protein
MAMSTSEMKPTPDEIERLSREEFCLHHSAVGYRERFERLYPWWHEYNDTHFGGRLTPPRISIAPTSPRRFSETRLTTDYGARTNIVFSKRMMFGTDKKLIRTEDFQAAGWLKFIADRLLGEMVKQYVLEVEGSAEETWDGYGPLYAREATRIGETLGLPEVHPRRRGVRLAGMPVAASWPHAFRDDGYYEGHVSFAHLLLRGRARAAAHRSVVPGVFEYLYLLAATGKTARLQDILYREVEAAKIARTPALAAAEENPSDPSGMRLPTPSVDQAWLHWNGGCVRAIAEGIRDRRAWDGMPILADALQEAGCEDPILLSHCRAHCDHTSRCWALRLLTEPAQS